MFEVELKYEEIKYCRMCNSHFSSSHKLNFKLSFASQIENNVLVN